MNVSAQNPVCWMAEKQEWKTMEIIKFTEQQRKDYEQLPTDMAIYQTIDGSLRPCWWQMNCADCCGSAGKTWSLTWTRACLVLATPMISAGWLILARISRLTQMRNTMFFPLEDTKDGGLPYFPLLGQPCAGWWRQPGLLLLQRHGRIRQEQPDFRYPLPEVCQWPRCTRTGWPTCPTAVSWRFSAWKKWPSCV